jgi:hypothetical protein
VILCGGRDELLIVLSSRFATDRIPVRLAPFSALGCSYLCVLVFLCSDCSRRGHSGYGRVSLHRNMGVCCSCCIAFSTCRKSCGLLLRAKRAKAAAITAGCLSFPTRLPHTRIADQLRGRHKEFPHGREHKTEHKRPTNSPRPLAGEGQGVRAACGRAAPDSPVCRTLGLRPVGSGQQPAVAKGQRKASRTRRKGVVLPKGHLAVGEETCEALGTATIYMDSLGRVCLSD